MLETLILGVIAALLFFKLFSVLGKRTGNERPQPGRFERTPPPTARSDNVIPLPDRKGSAIPPQTPNQQTIEDQTIDGQTANLPRSLADGLAEIRQVDASFDEAGFLHGARSAFAMIVSAFAAGDSATLRPLLADAVFSRFSAAIAERQRKGVTLETSIVSYEDVDLIEARLDGRDAFVTVRFITRQTNVIRGADGVILDGGGAPEEVVDLWSFFRDTRSRDPNWLLVATRTP